MTFNLITEQWIPVAPRQGGPTRWIKPAEITQAGNVEFAWGRADLSIASYELLIGLLAVAFPPQSEDQWIERLEAPPSVNELEAAFVPLIPWFNLDGDGPRFLQDYDDFEGEELPTDQLFIDAPGANTIKNGGDLFVKSGRFSALSLPTAAIALFALQAFAPSGGAGHRTSLRGGGPLTTLIQGNASDASSLWYRLWANVPYSRSQIEPLPTDWSNQAVAARIFPWCAPTPTSENKQSFLIGAGHPLQACFGMPRRIRLAFSVSEGEAGTNGDNSAPKIVTGFKMKSYGINYDESWNTPGWRHPLTPYYTPKTAKDGQELPVHPKSSHLGYKQWAGLIYSNESKDKNTGAGRGISKNIHDFIEATRDSTSDSLNILAAGYIMDNAKVVDFLEAHFPLIIANNEMIQDVLEETASIFVKAAEFAASAVRSNLGKTLKADAGSTIIEGPVNQFWAVTEAPFRQSLQELSEMHDEGTLATKLDTLTENWIKCLRRESLAAFDCAAPPESLINKRPTEQAEMINARKKLLSVFGSKTFYAIFGQEPPSKPKTKGEVAA